MRMNSISALKVAVSENLLYGLIFLPLWFRDQAGGLLRVALWLSRTVVATAIGITITHAFRNDDIPAHALCACINGRALASMQYSSPPFVQPSCTSAISNATAPWRVCDDVGDLGGGELSNETMGSCNYTDDLGSGESDPRPLFLPASNTRTRCWRCTVACCGAYLNARQTANEERQAEALSGLGIDVSEVIKDYTDRYTLETGCDPPDTSSMVESLATAMCRWGMLEPVAKALAYGKWCFKSMSMKLRLLLLIPWTAYTIYFAVALSRISAVYQETFGASDEDLGSTRSGMVTSLLLNMLLYDLVKEFAWAKAFKSEDDLDEYGLPIIETGQSKRVSSE